jgi:hypothetical protein
MFYLLLSVLRKGYIQRFSLNPLLYVEKLSGKYKFVCTNRASSQVLEPMLAFAITITIGAMHNMLALLLDPHYKGL